MLNASRLITVIGSILGATSSSNKWKFCVYCCYNKSDDSSRC